MDYSNMTAQERYFKTGGPNRRLRFRQTPPSTSEYLMPNTYGRRCATVSQKLATRVAGNA